MAAQNVSTVFARVERLGCSPLHLDARIEVLPELTLDACVRNIGGHPVFERGSAAADGAREVAANLRFVGFAEAGRDIGRVSAARPVP